MKRCFKDRLKDIKDIARGMFSGYILIYSCFKVFKDGLWFLEKDHD